MFYYCPLFSLWAFPEECGSRRAPFVCLHSNEARTAAAGTDQGPRQVAFWHLLSPVEFGRHLGLVYIVTGCQEILSGGHKLSSPIIFSDKM